MPLAVKTGEPTTTFRRTIVEHDLLPNISLAQMITLEKQTPLRLLPQPHQASYPSDTYRKQYNLVRHYPTT